MDIEPPLVEGEPALPFIDMYKGAQRRKRCDGMVRISWELSAPVKASLIRALEKIEALKVNLTSE